MGLYFCSNLANRLNQTQRLQPGGRVERRLERLLCHPMRTEAPRRVKSDVEDYVP